MVRAGFPGRMGPRVGGRKRIVPSLLTPTTVWMGDSITASVTEGSLYNWTNFFLDGRLVPVLGYNQGVSGNTTDAMLARQSTGLALNPNLYMILAGTNDIVIGGKSATYIIANLQTMIDNALATPSVKFVCIRTILKRSDASFTANPNFEAVRQAVNAWIASISNPKVIPVNYDASAFNPATHTADGLHPNQKGAVLLGRYTAQALAPYLLAADVLADGTGNMLNNPALTGTSGSKTNVTGPVATSWNIRNFTGVASAGVVASQAAIGGGNNAQIVTLNGTPTGGGGYIQFRNAPTYSGVAGEVYEMLCRLQITNGAGMACVEVMCDGTDNFGTNDKTAPISEDLSGVLRLGRKELTGSDTQNVMDINIHMLPVAISGLTITISQPIWRKVS